MSKSDFLIPGARLAFTELRQTFVKAPIRYYFNPKCHIRIKTNAFGYAIGGVLSQLTLDNLSQWHLLAFFSKKMILAETRYKTYDSELLTIVEAFKTWKHYLEGFHHEMLVPTDHNKLRQFMDTKSLSSRQVYWAQELSCYHFQIDYRQGNANGAANALSWYPQQSTKEEEAFHTKNVKIFHRLQLSLAKVSGLSTSCLSPLHQILIYGITVFPLLRQFSNSLQSKIAQDSPYIANIEGMRL